MSEKSDIPGTEEEAAVLRPYVPLGTLEEIGKIRDQEIAAADKLSRKRDELIAERNAIKERMRQDRIRLKKCEKTLAASWSVPLFPLTDAAREASWAAAAKARRQAIAGGETPLAPESCEQCGARQRGASAIYTP